ncbi:zinc ribbon domain-containing protein [Methanobacterium sp.]|uniref:zinc ribbon domain-containing protein n=1 Tax=Methanobacterium sp. TaxID=2164 RepID=UPI003C7508E8
MVSTVICPRCKTKNSKKAKVCYNCKNTLIAHKKPSILSSNPESKFEPKIIIIGAIIFIISNAIILDIAYDYSILVSGFATMVYLYYAFKNSSVPLDSKNKTRTLGFKIIVHYLIIVLVGIIALLAMGYVN